MAERKADRHGWIKTRLAERGYMQKDLVKAWGVTAAVVSRFIATGEPELTWDRAQSLSFMLDMSLDELKVRLTEGIAPRAAPPRLAPPARAVEVSVADLNARLVPQSAEHKGKLDALMTELYHVAERVRRILPGMEVNVTFSCRGQQ
jgi:hypothetical protein